MDWSGFATAFAISASVLLADAGMRRSADWLLELPGHDMRTRLGYMLLRGIPNVLGLALVLVGLGYDLTIYLYRDTLAVEQNLLASLDETWTGLLTLGAGAATVGVALVLFARIVIVERHSQYDIMERRSSQDADFDALASELEESKAGRERNAIASVGAVSVMLPSLMLFYHV